MHSVSRADGVEDFIIDLTTQSINLGTNVLAVQVHNTTLNSSDLSFIPLT